MSKKDYLPIILGSFLMLYVSGLPLTSVFVIVPYFVLLMIYFRVFNTAQSPVISSDGKAVFITGCDTGFGNALASRLAEGGFLVFAGCLNPEQNGAKELLHRAPENRLKVVKCDITSDEIMQNCLEEVKNNLGEHSLWALVNNAGIAYNGFTEWTSLDMYRRHWEINVLGTVRTTKLFLPLLRQKHRRIVNVSSVAGRVCMPGFSAYSMSKHAVRAFSDSLRREVKRFGVRVVTIEPTLYRTPISSDEIQIQGAMKQWDDADKEVKDAYSQTFFNAYLKAVAQVSSKARANNQEVVDVLTHAVTSTRPDRDYSPHWSTKLKVCFLHVLPLSLEDWVMEKITPVCHIEKFM